MHKPSLSHEARTSRAQKKRMDIFALLISSLYCFWLTSSLGDFCVIQMFLKFDE